MVGELFESNQFDAVVSCSTDTEEIESDATSLSEGTTDSHPDCSEIASMNAAVDDEVVTPAVEVFFSTGDVTHDCGLWGFVDCGELFELSNWSVDGTSPRL